MSVVKNPFVVLCQDARIAGVFLFVCLMLSICSSSVAAEHWPQFRGTTTDGQADASGMPLKWSARENVKWKTAIHGRGWSSPVVWGKQIWMTTATKDGKRMYVVCADLDTGKILHDILLFENEKPAYKHPFNSYASPTPVVEAEKIYVSFGSYGTACLDTATGKALWMRRDLKCDHFRGPGSSPFVYGDLLIIHFDGFDLQYVVALDKSTGKTVWKTDRSNDFQTNNGDFKKAFCTPIVIDAAGKKQLISPGAKAVTSYDPLTGKEFWQVRFKSHSATARPLFEHGLVFISTGFGKADLLAIRPDGSGDVTQSHVAWKVRKSIGSKPSFVIVGDYLYVVHDLGVASCLEAKTGKVIWSKRLGGNYSASPVAVDGRIYFFSQEGTTTVIKPGRDYKVLATNKLDSGFMASPAIVGKSFILRTKTHLLRIEEG